MLLTPLDAAAASFTLRPVVTPCHAATFMLDASFLSVCLLRHDILLFRRYAATLIC